MPEALLRDTSPTDDAPLAYIAATPAQGRHHATCATRAVHSCVPVTLRRMPRQPPEGGTVTPAPFYGRHSCALFNLRPVPYKKGRKEYMT
ncbi:hypothetical protein Deval_0185 [Nitratidesulfovibrio vulgaris RCH1]|nr:hypothetical protein Deval_0185 [Nitratidesulfovibrio vulgaris RCH1]